MAIKTITVDRVDIAELKKQLNTVMDCYNTSSDTTTKENLMGVENLLSAMIRIGEAN